VTPSDSSRATEATAGLRKVNVFTSELQWDDGDPDGYNAGYYRFGDDIGGAMLGATIYELPPGESNCPYHYEYGNEEWLVVLAGRLSVRHPGGEQELEPGDTVAFVNGPAGAHRLTNRGDGTVRVLMVSTKVEPNAAVYPDSDKIGLWPGDDRDKLMVRRADANVDYWEGET
jgi:uncharacterized cupin superfamily protein